MILREQLGIQWLEFHLLQDSPQVIHGVFLRQGGESEGPFAGLNVSDKVGDGALNVRKNRKKIQRVLALEGLFLGNLCHGDGVQEVVAIEDKALQEPSDGFFTKQKNLGLMVSHADCQAVIFYDPCHEAIANVHCGWKGNALNIFEKTLSKMKKVIGSDPQDVLVCISPSLGPSNSEFLHYEKEIPQEFHSDQIKPYYFDLWQISYKQLRAAGVLSRHIEIAKMCSYENPEMFFSYRRDKITGRNATVIALRQST